MSERIKGFTVALSHDIRNEKEIERITGMIMMIKGVESVSHLTTDPGDIIAEMRVRNELREKLYKIIDEL